MTFQCWASGIFPGTGYF